MKIRYSCLLLASLVALACNQVCAANKERISTSMKSVRTYMNFPNEIDPAHILSMADLELSVALASPLVTFDQERQITAALAEKWEIIPPKTIQFKLRKNLVWSDGTPILAEHFKLSLERAKRSYPNDLKALFETIESISVADSTTLRITTNTDIQKSGILLKLTEPMYSLLAIKDGKIDLSKTSGPFSISKQTENEVVLKANARWYSYTEKMPHEVVVRRIPKDTDLVEHFQKDDWANLVSGSSLMQTSTRQELEKAGFKTWQRSLDKVFSLYPSKKFLKKNGAKILKVIAAKIDYDQMMSGMSGYSHAEQFFPRGYELWSTTSPKTTIPDSPPKLGALKIIIPSTTYAASLKQKMASSIAKVTNAKPEVEIVPLSSLNERMKLGDYDLLATGIAVADPNFEGAMSFFIERDPAFIPSADSPNDFSAQLRTARGLPTSKDRAIKMKEIILKAQEAGHVLPLFHFSSLAIAKPGIDLSQVPNTDETVLFSKVRVQ